MGLYVYIFPMYLIIMCRVVKNGTKLHLFTARDCKLVDPLGQVKLNKKPFEVYPVIFVHFGRRT